jgi:hypothetical protein
MNTSCGRNAGILHVARVCYAMPYLCLRCHYSSSLALVTVEMTGAAGATLSAQRILLGNSRVLVSPASPTRSGSGRAGRGHAGNGREQVAPAIGVWVAACFPGGCAADEAQIHTLVMEAADAARSDYGVEAALAWADGYVFPPEAIQRDMASLESAGWDFEVMVRERLESLASNRMSDARIATLREDNPERALLHDLVIGMKVHVPEGFKPNGHQPRSDLRDIYIDVAPAMNKMYGAVIADRLAFLLPLDLALQHVPNLHLSKAHWCPKKGKPSGRPLGDLSNVDGTRINTDETAKAASDYYGAIRHPTIEDIAKMIHDFWMEARKRNPRLRQQDLRLWKMDLKGAYTLLSFRPSDAGLFAMLLTDDLVYFQLAGIFGWGSTPAAFQVVTRAITWELSHSLRSRTVMYVDDIIGICFAGDLDADLVKTRAICTNLLGCGAVADDKTESGRKLEVIGYTICLDTERVGIAEKNFLKALHGFATTDVTARLTLKQAQRLASWGTRYGKICRVMRPFCSYLNRVTWGRTSAKALFYLSAEAIIAIQCWRAMLSLVRFRAVEFTRSISSFAPEPPVLVAEFDSSLSGSGVIWYARDSGTEVVLGVCAVCLGFLGFGADSSNQNLAEYIGAIIAVAGQVVLGHSGRSLALRGDSVTALTWAISERPRGKIVTNASMVWTLLCVATNIDVREVTHIPGDENERCDRLSRRGMTPGMSVREEAREMGIEGGVVIEVNGDEEIMGLLRLCDPRRKLESDSDFIAFWTGVRDAVNTFVDHHVSPHPFIL